MGKKKKTLTEMDWEKVFRLRCRSKKGEELSREDYDFCVMAYKEDPKRYSAMDKEVFNATKPFGAW
jgi:hypothetical protein